MLPDAYITLFIISIRVFLFFIFIQRRVPKTLIIAMTYTTAHITFLRSASCESYVKLSFVQRFLLRFCFCFFFLIIYIQIPFCLISIRRIGIRVVEDVKHIKNCWQRMVERERESRAETISECVMAISPVHHCQLSLFARVVY